MGQPEREREKKWLLPYEEMIFSPSDLCRKSRPSHIWEHRIVILCKAHKEHIIYICVCTHFLSIIWAARRKFHHQDALENRGQEKSVLFHMSFCILSQNILKRVTADGSQLLSRKVLSLDDQDTLWSRRLMMKTWRIILWRIVSYPLRLTRQDNQNKYPMVNTKII